MLNQHSDAYKIAEAAFWSIHKMIVRIKKTLNQHLGAYTKLSFRGAHMTKLPPQRWPNRSVIKFIFVRIRKVVDYAFVQITKTRKIAAPGAHKCYTRMTTTMLRHRSV